MQEPPAKKVQLCDFQSKLKHMSLERLREVYNMLQQNHLKEQEIANRESKTEQSPKSGMGADGLEAGDS